MERQTHLSCEWEHPVSWGPILHEKREGKPSTNNPLSLLPHYRCNGTSALSSTIVISLRWWSDLLSCDPWPLRLLLVRRLVIALRKVTNSAYVHNRLGMCAHVHVCVAWVGPRANVCWHRILFVGRGMRVLHVSMCGCLPACNVRMTMDVWVCTPVHMCSCRLLGTDGTNEHA